LGGAFGFGGGGAIQSCNITSRDSISDSLVCTAEDKDEDVALERATLPNGIKEPLGVVLSPEPKVPTRHGKLAVDEYRHARIALKATRKSNIYQRMRGPFM